MLEVLNIQISCSVLLSSFGFIPIVHHWAPVGDIWCSGQGGLELTVVRSLQVFLSDYEVSDCKELWLTCPLLPTSEARCVFSPACVTGHHKHRNNGRNKRVCFLLDLFWGFVSTGGPRPLDQ